MGVEEDIAVSEAQADPTPVEAAVKIVKAGHVDDIDIAAQIIANYVDEIGPDGWSKEEEKKLMRKVDLWLIPIVGNPTFLTSYAFVAPLLLLTELALCMCHAVWS